jgi:hypothetical protein
MQRWFLVRLFFGPEDRDDTLLQKIGSHTNWRYKEQSIISAPGAAFEPKTNFGQ